MEGMSIQSPLGTDNTVTQATIQVVYEDADGVEREMEIPVSSVATLARLGGVQQQADGTLVVDFGGQIAVKKVSLRITATSGSSNLAEISKVEFLNDMESRIPVSYTHLWTKAHTGAPHWRSVPAAVMQSSPLWAFPRTCGKCTLARAVFWI